MIIDLTKLDALNKAAQASSKVAKAQKALDNEVVRVLHAMSPTAPPVPPHSGDYLYRGKAPDIGAVEGG